MKQKFLTIATIFLTMTLGSIFCRIGSRPISDGFPILEYHMITDSPDETSFEYSIPPEIFAKQLDFLLDQGYLTITLRDFERARRGEIDLPENPIVLTFDDGYSDNFYELLPILESRKQVAVIYIVANLIGTPGYLTWGEIQELQRHGIEIGCHTANHMPLENLSINDLQREILDSKRFIEIHGIAVESFSYPNGIYDSEVQKFLSNGNYTSAVTGKSGLNNFATDRFELHRTNIPHPKIESLAMLEFELRLIKSKFQTEQE